MQNNYDLKAIFKLARIEFSDETLVQDINKILEFVRIVDKVQDIKVDECKRSNNLRKDDVKPSLPVEDVLKNASLTEDNLIVAPKIFSIEDK